MHGITKRFPGVVANDDIALRVDAGEIHGLLGENGAGKTTLMRILYGLVPPDQGVIEVDGRQVVIDSPRVAVSLGIGMVHQHFMLVPGMTVAENIALGLETDRSLFQPTVKVAKRAKELIDEFGFGIEPDQVVDDLSVGQRQQVEILRLLYRSARILVLDEPTAALSPVEWQRLSGVLRSLVDSGASVVLITHKLKELLGIADTCTVIRRGRVVGTVAIADADQHLLARMMVGRRVELDLRRTWLAPGAPLLKLRNLSLTDGQGVPRLRDIDLDVREHEIVGVAGVEGNGQRELVDVITGMRPPTGGEIWLDGLGTAALTARQYIARSGAVIPEDRHRTGLALDMTVAENLAMKQVGAAPLSRRGVLSTGEIRRWCRQLIAANDIRTPSADVLARQLSGGNQQKIVLGRELARDPRVLVAANPSRGLDVGALEFVYRRIDEHCKRGGGTLLISSELDELLALSDRLAVLAGGRIVDIVDPREVDHETLGLLMAGGAAETT